MLDVVADYNKIVAALPNSSSPSIADIAIVAEVSQTFLVAIKRRSL